MLKDLKYWFVHGFGKTEKMASQTVSQIQEIWKTLDPEMSLHNNKLKAVDEIEDFFFLPHFNKLREQIKLPMVKQTNHIQASTIASKLTALNNLILFLASRDVYIG